MKSRILKVLRATGAKLPDAPAAAAELCLLPADPSGALPTILQAAPTPIFYADLQGRCLGSNEAFLQWFGLQQKQIFGQPLAAVVPQELAGACGELIRSRQGQTFELAVRCADGRMREIAYAGALFHDPSGQAAGIVATLYDLSPHKCGEKELLLRVEHDPLTGLPNRVHLLRHLAQQLREAPTQGTQLAILCLDLDRFKLINETLGYALADRLLHRISHKLREALRSRDLLTRASRDEFTFLLPGIAHRHYVEFMAERILTFLAEPVALEGHEIFCTGSIGIALAPQDGSSAEELLQKAETAMYQAKAQGKNTYRFYHQQMESGALERLGLETALRRALVRREELHLSYQPQVDLASSRLVGVEALARWDHPDWGPVSPAKFIPVAEESGLILPLGEWVLQTACAQAKAWQEAGLPPVRMAVNLSGHQLTQPGFVPLVEKILRQSGLDAAWLELELTETTMMDNTEGNILTLQRLRDLGIHLAIDDFGTGYSSLGYLKRFPIHKLKIDRTFVSNITTDSNDAAIIDAVIAMARSLRFKVVAEGVETAEQLAFLRERGCDELQGYYFGKPMTAEDIRKLLTAGKPLP